jgi:EAL and modified HD-GYP domain-containing signal transduction protein
VSAISVLLARQPIFDTRQNIVAYELLFRSANAVLQKTIDGDQATSQVLLNAFTELPITEVIENKQAFVNFTRKLILNPPPIHQAHLVVEVLETVSYDNEVHKGLLTLKELGYTIALDDFIYNERLQGLVEIADIIKLDVLAMSFDDVKKHLQQLSKYDVTFLAEKVETHEMFEECKQLGFELFQGYFLSRPQLISGTKIAENKQSILKLIGKLQDPDIDMDEVVGAISMDPVLSFKLLKLINSSLFSFSTEIASIKHAVTLLGLQKTKSWATLLAIADNGEKPKALAVVALNRARLCQLLGMDILADNSQAESYFTSGLMSTLDAFFNTAIDVLLQQLSLSREIEDAILHNSGDIGFALSIAKLCEEAKWELIDWTALISHKITPERFKQHYLDSIRWTKEIMEQF